MSIIFLDDDPRRQRAVKSILPRVVQVYTAQEAIDTIRKTQTIECLFLDHDLGGEIMVDSTQENTGANVARWLVSESKNLEKIMNIIIHSCNPVGAENMYQKLSPKFNNVYIMPFLSDGFNSVLKNL